MCSLIEEEGCQFYALPTLDGLLLQAEPCIAAVVAKFSCGELFV